MCTTNDENRMERELAFTLSPNRIDFGPSYGAWCDEYGVPIFRYREEWPCQGGNITANEINSICTRNFMKGLETTLVLQTHNGPMHLTWPDPKGGCLAFSKCKCYSDGSIDIEYIKDNKNKTKNMKIVYDGEKRQFNLKPCLNKIYKTKH